MVTPIRMKDIHAARIRIRFVCPKNPGSSLIQSYDLHGDGIQTINPTIFGEGSGFLGQGHFCWQLYFSGDNKFQFH